MASIIGLLKRNYFIQSPPKVPKAENALKFGILGAANIAPSAFINPAKTHPEVIVQAVAARDKGKAAAFAEKHGIPQVLDSYQAILDDSSIDCVYIPLPNGLHYEWTLRALAAGKHVLLEKPSTSNAVEAESLFRHPLLQQPGAPVLLEAFHYRFQPTWQHFLSLVDRPNIESVRAATTLPTFLFKDNDIRFNFDLAGGALMDLGTYQLSVLRQVIGAEPEECTECITRPGPQSTDAEEAVKATFRFHGGITGVGEANLRGGIVLTFNPEAWVVHKPVVVEEEGLPADQEKVRVRRLYLSNFMISGFLHKIIIEDDFIVRKKGAEGAEAVVKKWTKKEVQKVYTWKEAGIDRPSEPYWASYRHQLEGFVHKVRGREGSGVWIDGEDSIAQAKMIDMAYAKAGLPMRPSKNFKLDTGAEAATAG